MVTCNPTEPYVFQPSSGEIKAWNPYNESGSSGALNVYVPGWSISIGPSASRLSFRVISRTETQTVPALLTVTSKVGVTSFVRSSVSEIPESLAAWRSMAAEGYVSQ